MKNIEKYNKYYGKEYDVKKIVYCLIFVLVIITFFFGPIGGSEESYLSLGMNYDQINLQENPNPIISSQEKDLNNQGVIESSPKKEKYENKDNKVKDSEENEGLKKSENIYENKEFNKKQENINKIKEDNNKLENKKNKEIQENNNKIKDEKEKKKEEKNKNHKDEINKKKESDQENDKKILDEKENYTITKKKSKGFWKKLFLMSGFLGIIYYLIWNESNNPGEEDINGDDDNNKSNKSQKTQKMEKNGYLLLNNNEEFDI